MLTAAGLKSSAQSKRIVFDGPRCTVIDRPFAEIRPFFEAADPAEVLSLEPESAAPRDPMRRKLGAA
jgi:hypothetical protein